MPEYETLDSIIDYIEHTFDGSPKTRTSVLFANNTSGKTRLSKLLSEKFSDKVLCYNAFIEDLFTWDNENFILNLANKSEVHELIAQEGLNNSIIDTFKKLANSKIEPDFSPTFDAITFTIPGDKKLKDANIKISKGEESLFIWSVFYSILTLAIETLFDKFDNRSTHNFDKLKYIVIDDPVSSMDDSRIITIAFGIIELLEKVFAKNSTLKDELRFLITTHHALFFNCLRNSCNDKWHCKNFVLSKTDGTFVLKEQKSGAPFAYHHAIIEEILEAIKNDSIEKYHFNLFRCLLEKTTNFLGYTGNWSQLLKDEENRNLFAKVVNEYSHSQISETEPKYVDEKNKVLFKEAFYKFIREYKWSYANHE